MRHEEPPHLGHTEADGVLLAALRGEATEVDAGLVLVGLALFDDDRTFVERWCLRVGREAPDLELRGLAALCIGSHLARRFGEVGEEAARLVRELAADERVREANRHVLDAAEDLDLLLGQRRQDP